MFRQYALIEHRGQSRRVGWIEHEPRLSKGTLLTLKGDDRLWCVEVAGYIARQEAPDQPWKVGGLCGRTRFKS